jgi:hypothetical protein
MVEVAEIHPENDIRITEDGVTAQLLKTGLYDFNQKQNELRVFDGKASVEDGAKSVTVMGGLELSLEANSSPKAQKFDRKSCEEGDLYRWSSLRSSYLAEANVDAAGIYAANGGGPWGYGWLGASWYWDPWFDAFTFHSWRRNLLQSLRLGLLFTVVGVPGSRLRVVWARIPALLSPLQHELPRVGPGLSLCSQRSLCERHLSGSRIGWTRLPLGTSDGVAQLGENGRWIPWGRRLSRWKWRIPRRWASRPMM